MTRSFVSGVYELNVIDGDREVVIADPPLATTNGLAVVVIVGAGMVSDGLTVARVSATPAEMVGAGTVRARVTTPTETVASPDGAPTIGGAR